MKQEKLSGWLGAIKRLVRPLSIAVVLGTMISGAGIAPASANTAFVGLVTAQHSLHVQHPLVRNVSNMENALGAKVEITTLSRETTYKKEQVDNRGRVFFTYVCRDITTIQTRVVSVGQRTTQTVSGLDRLLDGVAFQSTEMFPTSRNLRHAYTASNNTSATTVDYAGMCSNNVDVWDRHGRALWGTDAARAVLAAGAEIAVSVAGGYAAAFALGLAGLSGTWTIYLAACVGGAASYAVMGLVQGSMNSPSDAAWYVSGGCVLSALALLGGNAAGNANAAGLALRQATANSVRNAAINVAELGALNRQTADYGTMRGIEMVQVTLQVGGR